MTVTGFADSPLRFDQLVLAINGGERLLGVPYPSPSVTMRQVSQLSGGFCGHNQMSYATRYSRDSYVVDNSIIEMRVDEDCYKTFAAIAHEVAHTWFHGNDFADWIDEGLADSIEHQVVAAYQEGQETQYPPVTYCESYRNINELERGAPGRVTHGQSTGFSCNYRLGNGIFGALREHYGDDEFNDRIAQLARRGTNDTQREHTISDIRTVLGGEGPALDIINRWYDGQPEMRKYRHLDAVRWTFPPTIDGDYLHFAGTTDQPELVQDFVLGKDPYCSQFSLYNDTGKQKWVASVSEPLLAGWRHDGSKVITVNHQISPNTGEFSVTARIVGSALSDFRDLSLKVISRVTTGEAGTCNESINYSQIPVVLGEIPRERRVAKYYHLNAVEWTFPPTIDGDYLHFAGKTDQPGMVQDFVLGKDPYCSQFVLYQYIVNQEWVATVSDPLLAGWRHGETPGVVVVSHHISPDIGEFSVTAKINGNALADINELSLLVRNRVTTDADGACATGDIYSQVPVVSDSIPSDIKTSRHYSLDAIQWVTPPTISGNTLRFVGQALPRAITLTWQEGYCSQFRFYERDESGYHYIDSINLLLPENRHWTGEITGEVTEQRTSADGTFEALVKLSDDALAGYQNPVLLVKTQAPVNSETNKCGKSDVLSAVDIR